MKNARPIARGCTRLSDGPPSAIARTTRRSSRLRTWWLCSALATAERSTFSMRRAAARGVNCERGQGVAHRLAADLVEDQPRLAGGHADEPGPGARWHGYDFPVGVAEAFSAWPCALKVRVSANSPSLWPTMFSVT